MAVEEFSINKSYLFVDFRIHVEEFLDGASKINKSKPIFKVETLVNEIIGKPFKIWNNLLLNKEFQNHAKKDIY